MGEVKWADDIGPKALRQLRESAGSVPGFGDHTRLALFARPGSDDDLRKVAEAEGILLSDVDDLFRAPTSPRADDS